MRQFTRAPTARERILGVVANAFLALLFGALSFITLTHDSLVPGIVFSMLMLVFLVMLCRALFGRRRALGRKGIYWMAWGLTLFGVGGIALVLLVDGTTAHELMLLGHSLVFAAAGLVGIRSRGYDD